VHGEAWAPAASYLYRAGAKAQAEARYAAAMTFFERSIEAVNHLGEAGDRGLELDAYLDLWSTRISTSQVDGLGELGSKVEALARALDDGPRLARVQVRQAQAIAFAAAIPGTLHSALARAREAATRADASDLRTRSYARFIAGVACRDIGQIDKAIEEYDRGANLFASTAPAIDAPGLVYPIFVSLCSWRAEAHAALGHFEAALVSATEAVRVATQIRHPSSLSIANMFLGYVKLLQGDVPTAVDALERGLALAEEHDLVHGICANAIYLAWASVLMGNHSRGLEYLARGLERPVAALLQWTRFGSVSAAIYLGAHQPKDARRVIAAGLNAMAERDAQGYRAALIRLDAEVMLDEGDTAGAQRRAQEGLAAAVELGTSPDVARCHATLGKIAARLGETTAAAEHVETARRIFEDLGLHFWASRVAVG
jgi:tetratricopeptide (TPR) repeat protein